MLKKFTLLICMLGSIGLSFANNLHSEDKLIIQSITNGDDSPTFHSPIREINIKGLSTCAGSLYNINHYAHSYYYKIGLPR